MAGNPPSSDPISGWEISQPNYLNNPRYAVVKGKALFKQVRVENGRRLYIELVNELICNEFAGRVGVPVVPTFVGVIPGLGSGLLSIMLGEQDFNPADSAGNSSISNIGKLKTLFVFDQWVFNDDRKVQHIRVGNEPGRPEVKLLYAFDHGHTLNGYNGKKWTLASFSDKVAASVAQVLFDSGISSFSELAGPISRIQDVTDNEIENVVETFRVSVDRFGLSEEERAELDSSLPVVKRILRTRRNVLPDIIHSWCTKTGKTA